MHLSDYWYITICILPQLNTYLSVYQMSQFQTHVFPILLPLFHVLISIANAAIFCQIL